MPSMDWGVRETVDKKDRCRHRGDRGGQAESTNALTVAGSVCLQHDYDADREQREA